MKHTLLITGGAGYIGAQTAWLALDAGHEVLIVDDLSTGVRGNVPPAAAFVQADIADRPLMARLMREHGVTALIHFAAKLVLPESVAKPAMYYRANVGNLCGVLEACEEAGVKRWIFSSTAAIYGEAPEPASETTPPSPQSPYGRSKLMAEQALADAASATGARAIALRYFNVAGADPDGRTGQSTAHATHLFKVACQVACGKREALDINGEDFPTRDGTGLRDYIHVHDLARAHLLALDQLERTADGMMQVINLGSGTGATVREVVDAVSRAAGQPLPTRRAPRRPGDVAALIADASLAETKLGWTPRFTIDEIGAHALTWERRL